MPEGHATKNPQQNDGSLNMNYIAQCLNRDIERLIHQQEDSPLEKSTY